MSAAIPGPSRRPRASLITAVAVGAAGLAITGGGVYAALTATATNTTAQSAKSGVLSLTMGNNGAGFSQPISNLAPGDVVNRYVTLTQGPDLAGKNLTLAVTDATPTPLTSDATRGLRATITQCSVPWVPGTGACDGTSSVLSAVSDKPLSTLTPTSPATVVKTDVAANSVLNLKVSLSLPDQNEVTVNGGPANGGTITTNDGMASIQGLSSSLTWTFSETQRTATVTGS